MQEQHKQNYRSVGIGNLIIFLICHYGQQKATFWEPSLCPSSDIWCDWVLRTSPMHACMHACTHAHTCTNPEPVLMTEWGKCLLCLALLSIGVSMDCLSKLVTWYHDWIRAKLLSLIKLLGCSLLSVASFTMSSNVLPPQTFLGGQDMHVSYALCIWSQWFCLSDEHTLYCICKGYGIYYWLSEPICPWQTWTCEYFFSLGCGWSKYSV